jgi:radical SAM family uncharacterized protein/radical SAM-linked protein
MLDKVLPLIKKPIRYTGGEYNITIKTNPAVQVGIVFPELYEIGMSNTGIKILYHLLNGIDGIQCERIFAPWPDFGERLVHEGMDLYGLETKKAIHEYDLLGFSLQTELCYTTVLYVLELARIPFRRAARDGRHPLLIAGGPAVMNPAPLSEVFDAFVIGDGEDAILEIGSILKNIPQEQKEARLNALARLAGVWVPSLHGQGTEVKRNTTACLDEKSLPLPPLLPICDITHDRFSIEVMRGCTWGCRFCQAGYVNRPVRIRSEEDVLNAAEKGIRQTGWEEISLLAFSILDYPDLLNMIRKLNETLRRKMINISLPAMRGELFSEDLGILLKEIKKTGLTFAPETASEQLRRRLNKSFSNERLISSINTAHRLGWKQVKLYFMIGLPFEEDSDIAEIDTLVREILKAYPRGGVKISVSPFVPKPHTPFQSVGFAPMGELQEKISRIRKIKRRRVEVKYQSPEKAFIEAVLSKADADIYPVIETVYKNGGKLEEWREYFDYARWQQAFDSVGIDPARYLEAKESFPWDFIDSGVKKAFLEQEMMKARDAIPTENCLYEQCTQCGACDGTVIHHTRQTEQYMSYGRYPRKHQSAIRYRVKYSVGEPFRYASHLDITRSIYRALRRSDLPIQFTQGFSPVPKVSFCPPKSVGQISKGDYFDMNLSSEYFGNISMDLNTRFPPGIRILDVRMIPSNASSLSSSINVMYYEVSIPRDAILKSLEFENGTVAYVDTKSGMKNVPDGLESLNYENGILTCGLRFGNRKVNLYELLSYLVEKPVEMTRLYKATRTTMFIKKDGILFTPMEVT